MAPDYFETLFTFTAAGIGLLAAGGLNVALGGRRVALRLAVTLLVCGGASAALATFARAEVVLRGAAVMAVVLAAAALFGSDWLARRVASLVAFLRRPAVRWGGVAASGLVVALGAGVAFEYSDARQLDEELQDLELLSGRPPCQPASGSRAATDLGTQVELKEPIAPRDVSALRGPEMKTLKDPRVSAHVIRRGEPTETSNCHGWVFTGGKFLLSPDDVEVILKDNGYREVREPRSGDLVIYRQGSAIAHSAVVRYVADGLPVMVEGKWGTMGVFMHPADKSFYGTEYTFYRSPRPGHLLAGIGGEPAPVRVNAVVRPATQ